MVKRIILMSILAGSVVVVMPTEAKAYTYSGTLITSQCVKPPGDTTPSNPLKCSFHTRWPLAGQIQPGNKAFVANTFTIETAALVCVNNSEFDVRGGAGGNRLVNGRTISTQVPENLFSQEETGTFVNERILTAVTEFQETFCATNPDPACGLAAMEAFYAPPPFPSLQSVCKPNWLPFEFYWGRVRAQGSIKGNCTDPADITSCGKIQDNVEFLCQPLVGFKDYGRILEVPFSCTCTQNCEGLP